MKKRKIISGTIPGELIQRVDKLLEAKTSRGTPIFHNKSILLEEIIVAGLDVITKEVEQKRLKQR